MKDKSELFKKYLLDIVDFHNLDIWLEAYANLMNKYDEVFELHSTSEKVDYFKNVVLKDNEYLAKSVNDDMLMEDVKMFYEES